MQKRKPIVSIPLLAGIALSIALHVAALYSRGNYTPPEPTMESGQTVVQLTLIPSTASQAAAQKIPPSEPEPEQPAEPVILEVPIPVEPIPELVPVPEPTIEPTPETPATVKSESSPSIDSMEQNASLQIDKGVTTEATVSGSFRPSYPRISQRRDETGTVKLSIQVNADGTVGKVSVLQSSGHQRLDDAAMEGAKKTVFNPAKKFGKNVETTTQLEFTFTLTDD